MNAGTPILISLWGVQNKTNTDDPKVEAEVVLVDKPAQYAIVSHWCDHLEGKKTAKVILRLLKNDAVHAEQDIFGGYHQRGEDEKYIHYEDLRGEDIVTQAEPGDKLQVCTICGPNDQYKEFEDVEGFIEYEAETRLFAFNMQINKDVDAGPVPAG